MRTTKPAMIRAAFLALSAIFLAVSLYGCAPTPAPTDSAAPATRPAFTLFPPAKEESGQRLWSDNCARCHNSRPPGEYSATQWAIIANHMRLRADLTGEEQRKITQFLQASN